MAETAALDQVALAAFRSRITRILPAQIRTCIEQLSDEQLWWRGNDESNSVGNLVLHVSGSARHYLSHSIGHLDYKRDRPAEFAERGPIPREELLTIFDETISEVDSVLASFETTRFTDLTDEPNYYATIFEQIFGVAVHMATHAGQIVYVTKMLKEGSLNELWIRTHRS